MKSPKKVADVRSLVDRGRRDLADVAGELHALAASEEWPTREVAATALVEIGKRQPDAVLALAKRWARDTDENVRRAASEGLRGIVKTDVAGVLAVIALLRADDALYVKKSVANVLRNASRSHPDAVLDVCRKWAQSRDPNTRWIVKDALRKLRAMGSTEADAIVSSL